MDKTVLIVEDEEKLREIMALFLRGEGLKVIEATTGEEALALILETKIDLVLLDVMLPDISGFEVCSQIRKISEVPILILTALSDDDYLMMGYRMGADDYIVKPFKASILALKVLRVLERHERINLLQNNANGIELDEKNFRCTVDGADVDLTYKEFQVLRLLMKNESCTMTRDSILDAVWGYNYFNESRVVDNHIKNIRHKLGNYSSCIKTVISVGYRYERSI